MNNIKMGKEIKAYNVCHESLFVLYIINETGKEANIKVK
jgi:hypothetical protein